MIMACFVHGGERSWKYQSHSHNMDHMWGIKTMIMACFVHGRERSWKYQSHSHIMDHMRYKDNDHGFVHCGERSWKYQSHSHIMDDMWGIKTMIMAYFVHGRERSWKYQSHSQRARKNIYSINFEVTTIGCRRT